MKNDSAFPYKTKNLSTNVVRECFGLTKLEYAAIEAMNGLLSSPRAPTTGDNRNLDGDAVVLMSVGIAKAILTELEKESE